MISNVALYPFDPARDEYFAYESSSGGKLHGAGKLGASRHVYGQIRFEVPWVSVPDSLTGPTLVSLEEMEREMERNARRQEY
jgi:hypothetical protein